MVFFLRPSETPQLSSQPEKNARGLKFLVFVDFVWEGRTYDSAVVVLVHAWGLPVHKEIVAKLKALGATWSAIKGGGSLMHFLASRRLTLYSDSDDFGRFDEPLARAAVTAWQAEVAECANLVVKVDR